MFNTRLPWIHACHVFSWSRWTLFFRKSDVTRGLNEGKLKRMKKGPRIRTLKSTKTWKLHQMLPTQHFQNVSKHEKLKKVKMLSRFAGSVEDRLRKKRSNKRCAARLDGSPPIRIWSRDSIILKNAELRFSKDADPNGGPLREKKYRRIQGYGRDIFYSKKLCFCVFL